MTERTSIRTMLRNLNTELNIFEHDHRAELIEAKQEARRYERLYKKAEEQLSRKVFHDAVWTFALGVFSGTVLSGPVWVTLWYY